MPARPQQETIQLRCGHHFPSQFDGRYSEFILLFIFSVQNAYAYFTVMFIYDNIKNFVFFDPGYSSEHHAILLSLLLILFPLLVY